MSGEGMTVLRSEIEMNGFMAWKILYHRYNPITPARALAALMEVLHPPKDSDVSCDVSLIPKAIDLWTMRSNNLEKEHGDKLSANMKKTVLVSMLPVSLQNLIYQTPRAARPTKRPGTRSRPS
jgi:hypothetical protein